MKYFENQVLVFAIPDFQDKIANRKFSQVNAKEEHVQETENAMKMMVI